MKTPRVPMYPVFVSLKDKHCLLVGMGSVGERKLKTLLERQPASVLVLDIRPKEELSSTARQLLAHPLATYIPRVFSPQDINDKFLVIAATGKPSINTNIAEECRKKGILCNCITNPDDGDVFLPAIAKRGQLTVALSTDGASPALAKRWRKELEAWLVPREQLLVLMARLRPRILALQKTTEENTQLFRSLAFSPLQELLASGDREQCCSCLKQLLPAELHNGLSELLNDIA